MRKTAENNCLPLPFVFVYIRLKALAVPIQDLVSLESCRYSDGDIRFRAPTTNNDHKEGA